jgi:hypothetical protein
MLIEPRAHGIHLVGKFSWVQQDFDSMHRFSLPGETTLAGITQRARARFRVGSQVMPFAELLDHLLTKRRQVVGLAAGHQPIVDDDFLIDPISPGIFQIGLQRRP